MSKRFRGKSSLLKLPKKILEQVNEMIVAVGEGRKTYEEISAWLTGQGYETSKSAVGRYAKYVTALEKVRMVGEQAKVIIEASGQDPLKIEEATAKLGAVIMMEVFQEAMSGDRIDVKHIGHLMGDFARLQKSSVDRERLKAVVMEKFEKAITDAKTKAKGMSKEDFIEFMKERLYGLL